MTIKIILSIHIQRTAHGSSTVQALVDNGMYVCLAATVVALS